MLSHGNTADNVARQYEITRAQQGNVAASQNKADPLEKGRRRSGMDEIVPFTIKTRKGDIIVSDDEIRARWRDDRRDGQVKLLFDKDGDRHRLAARPASTTAPPRWC